MNIGKNEFVNKLKAKQEHLKKANAFVYQPQQTSVCTQFLGKNSKIVTGYSNIVIDDDSVYENLYDNINLFLGKERNKNLSTALAIQKTVLDYYGIGKPANEMDKLMFLKLQYDKGENTSIGMLKGKRWATCMERSALAFDMFQSLGYKCSLIATDIQMENENCGHSFIVVQIESKYYVYDLICSKIFDKDMPSPIFCELPTNVGKNIIEGNIPYNFNLNDVEFCTQSGKTKTITYQFFSKIKTNQNNNEVIKNQ